MSFLWRTDALNDPRTWLIPNNLGKKLSKWKCSYEGQMPWIILEHGWYPSREVHPSPSHWSCTSQPNNSKLWDSFGILYFFLKAAIFPNNRVLANTMSFIKHLIFLRFPFPHLGNGKVRLNHLSLEIDIRPTSWSRDHSCRGKEKIFHFRSHRGNEQRWNNEQCLSLYFRARPLPKGSTSTEQDYRLNSLENTPICGGREAPTHQLQDWGQGTQRTHLNWGCRKHVAPTRL